MVRPLWNEQLPAFIGAAVALVLINCGYTSNILSIFLPMPLFSNVVSRFEPRTKNRQPFCSVASSSAIHIDNAFLSENDQNGVSRCHEVGLAHGRLIKAWSCHILMPSTPTRCAAILPMRSSTISFFFSFL